MSGDHACVFTPKQEEAQQAIANYQDPHVTTEDVEWLDTYIRGEQESDEVLILDGVLVKHKYTLYTVPMRGYTDALVKGKDKYVKGFSDYLATSVNAKKDVGVSTNDTWIFNMILEVYMKFYNQNKGHYSSTGKSKLKAMIPISQKDCNDISSTYVRALQDFVVRGIKHGDGGSANFEVLFLGSMHKSENLKAVNILLKNVLKVSPVVAAKMLAVVTWAQDMGLLSACSSFLKLYNKGTRPSKEEDIENLEIHEDFIQSNTYFGMLLQPLYDISKHKDRLKAIKIQEIKDLTNSMSDEDIFKSIGF